MDIDLQLGLVAYRLAPGGAKWSLALRWSVTSNPKQDPYRAAMQLFSDPGLDQGSAVGELVWSDTWTGAGSGTWDPETAGATLTPGTAYWIAVAASDSTKNPHKPMGPFSNPLPIIFDSGPALVTASFDGTSLDVAWSPSTADAAASSDYFVDLCAAGQKPGAGTPFVRKYVGGLGYRGAAPDRRLHRFDLGDVPFGLASGPFSLGLGARFVDPAYDNASSEGPVSTCALLTTSPVAKGAVTDPGSGQTTISWQAVDSATYSAIAWRQGVPSAPQLVSAPSFVVPGGTDAFTVAAVSGLMTGPYSARYPVPTLTPRITHVHYDGSSAAIEWTALGEASGFVASVLEGITDSPPNWKAVVSATAPAGATSAVLPFQIQDATKSYAVVVQACAGSDTGPVSERLPLFRAGFFVSTKSQLETKDTAQHLFPAASPAFAAGDLSFYLPPLLTGDVPKLSSGPFRLEPNTDHATASVWPAILSLSGAAGSLAWSFDQSTTIRSELQKRYIDFLTTAENKGVSARGIWILQQAISRFMPQNFAETLYYAYGLNLSGGVGTGYADLRPGMVLRVSFANYTNVSQGSQSPDYNGFFGGSSVDFEIGDTPGSSWLVGFDAFIAQLVASKVMSVLQPKPPTVSRQQAGFADVADLFYPSFQQPFFRLFFPNQLLDPAGYGSITVPDNFVIAAASSFTNLEASKNVPATNPVAYFRGRAIVKLCIHVTVNGEDLVVPVGTTVGNILDRFGRRPPAGVSLNAFSLLRATGPAVPSYGAASLPPAPPSFDVGASYRVWLDWLSLAPSAPGADPMMLPLLHGDRLTFAS